MQTPASQQETLSVSELNRQVKRLLDTSLDFIWVEGEISNLAKPGSGHWYFSLKDSRAQVRCAMFRNRNQRVRVSPANGDSVRLRAKASLYEGRGEFQLIVEYMEAAGAGALQQAFEELKVKLHAEGLFDAQRKRPLPRYPRHIGIISSASGAAVRDMITVFRRRSPGTRLTLLPVVVQGQAAPGELIAALDKANQFPAANLPPLDALIIGRGGGSIEDLWAFNDEGVARAIAASELPVVSAVGHEIDFTIADFVADVRAPTPSAAAELLSAEQPELLNRLRALEQSLQRIMGQKLHQGVQQLGQLRRLLKHPGDRLQEQSQRLDELEQRLRLSRNHQAIQRQQALKLAAAQLYRQSPDATIVQYRSALTSCLSSLHASLRLQLQVRAARIGRSSTLLNSLSPLATLDRGYALVTDADGAVITAAQQTEPGQTVTTRLARGSITSTVESVQDETG